MLVDQRNRTLRDLRISVTDQCNLRCRYCMPKEIFDNNFSFLDKEELLSFEEIVSVAKACHKVSGLKKLRITGGEPLLRKGLPALIEQLYNETQIEDIAMTTNGILLPKHAAALKEAGLKRVAVSLDSLSDDRFQAITGRTMKVEHVLNGIEAAQAAGLAVKVNMVVKKGMNEEDILPMAEFFRGKDVTLRYIEYMDVGNSNGWKWDHVISKKEIISMIGAEYPLVEVPPSHHGETASRYAYEDGSGEIGVISSVSDAFCNSCNRARLTADGQLLTCLFSTKGTDLKKVVRDEPQNLAGVVSKLWTLRDDNYSEERVAADAANKNKQKLEMHRVGG
ncbi:cyclic pyranopterin phosphate synthase [Alkalicoccus daliensis]|uniref:GTP 3',8-cyclase n=2 Tax=Alkalicoccus daliensis TaxID=745820 RepID=A0A1H0AG11_9BACI|nr:cyclic pyranopterin phosphate synthase [Alkalicoccus daliensis]